MLPRHVNVTDLLWHDPCHATSNIGDTWPHLSWHNTKCHGMSWNVSTCHDVATNVFLTLTCHRDIWWHVRHVIWQSGRHLLWASEDMLCRDIKNIVKKTQKVFDVPKDSQFIQPGAKTNENPSLQAPTCFCCKLMQFDKLRDSFRSQRPYESFWKDSRVSNDLKFVVPRSQLKHPI